MSNNELERYGIITEKNPREIVLLRGNGCKWRRCRFCNYHTDSSKDINENYSLNLQVLSQVKGTYGVLETINSGSFSDLDKKTIIEILNVCKSKNIKQLHFESHWIDREKAIEYKRMFENIGVTVKIKTGVETFDYEFREQVFCKGIDTEKPEDIADYFDECCLLLGVEGQTEQSMRNDIETGLKYFQRVCINIMQDNGMPVKSDLKVIKTFIEKIYPNYIDNNRVDILMHNTDFGVG